ncbi:MAG TPA: PAS domain S-box protein [candidate division Zixibacteria bacterium]|nr:PAS domain S-box protein [candidate division Zixibacteria bacterium]
MLRAEWTAVVDSGLRPLQASDVPDHWEDSALRVLAKGANEVGTYTSIDSRPYYRLMRPISVSDGCLNCHVRSEFHAGKTMGGVSVAVPIQPFVEIASRHSTEALLWRIAFWLVGILGLFWSFRAVSARERRNRADYNELALSEARLRQAQRIAQVGSWEVDLLAHKITWSSEMYRIFGMSRRTVLTPKTIVECTHPEDREFVLSKWDLLLKGQTIDIEFRLLINDRIVWVRKKASGKKGAGGKVILITGTTQDITTRKNSLEALRKGEERLALALEAADSGTLDWDIRSRTITFDKHWARMMGYEQREMTLGIDDFRAIVHPEDIERAAEAVNLHLKGDASQFEIENRLRHESGHYLCILSKGKITERNSIGDPIRVCGTHLNISERKRVEQAKAEESMRRRILLDQSMDGVVILDQSGGILEANQSFADMLGYTHEEVLKLHVWDWDAVLSREQLESMLKDTEMTNNQMETKFRTKSGEIIAVDIGANRATFDGKNLIFCVCHDISDRKRSEEELAVSNSLLRATLESTADGILVVDQKGRVATINRRFMEMWLIPDHIAAGGDDRELINTVLEQLVDPDAFLERVKQLYDAPLEESFDVLRFKDNRVFERYSTPQRIGNKIVGRVWSFRDVSARVRAEEEREQLRDQYFQAQKMEAIGQLAGGVAHDFNNLLQIMLGYTECAREETVENSKVASSLGQVESAIQQARGLVGQLLTFSRRRPLNVERFELDGAVARLSKMVSRLIGENIELVFKPGAPRCRVEADRILIEQVILNLCVNARDAMTDGGTLTIETRCMSKIRKGKDRGDVCEVVRMRISDTGCGMDKETLKHIFEPFFTTKGVGKGTGLGLASAFGAIKQHNGTIEVHSRPGEGTRFDVLLPVADIGEIVERTVVRGGAVEGGQETILVAEDDEVIRDLTRRILTKAGYSIIEAKDGIEAIELFRSNVDTVDLLLLDLMMPRKGGREVYQAVQHIRPGLPAIFASGFSKETLEMNLNENPNTALIQKPFRREQLLHEIRAVLDQHSGSGSIEAPDSSKIKSQPVR